MKIQTIKHGIAPWFQGKIGIDEVVGLKQAMIDLMKPIQSALKENIYWSDVELNESKYKSRDGFMPYSSNCGGIDIVEVIPQCEEYSFKFLDFGEWDGTHYCDGKDHENCKCSMSNDGELDAKLRIWFKFEGIDDSTKALKFYLYMGGGNDDAPYFRTKYEATLFEAEFECKSVKGLKRAASKHVNKLLKLIKE